jgi:cytochrome c5
MPAKGGNTDLDDVEVQRAVVYMANASGAKFAEPAAPAATAAAPAAPEPVAPQADPNVLKTIAAINAGQGAGAAPAAPAASTPAASTPTASTPTAAAGDSDAGKKLYDSVCMVCHAAGVAGAPKFGDKTAWAPRIAQGLDTLYDHAIHGYQGKAGVMPAKGGSGASDDEVKAAVRYITAAAK